MYEAARAAGISPHTPLFYTQMARGVYVLSYKVRSQIGYMAPPGWRTSKNSTRFVSVVYIVGSLRGTMAKVDWLLSESV